MADDTDPSDPTGPSGDDLGRRVLEARGRSVVEPVSVPTRALPKASWATVAALVVGAVVVLVALRHSTDVAPSRGTVTATERTEISLRHRGAAVLEAGAAIDWLMVAGGAITIEHRRGTVFYRSQGAGAFLVRGRFGEISPRKGSASFTVGTALTVHQGQLKVVCGSRETLVEPGPYRELPGCSAPE